MHRAAKQALDRFLLRVVDGSLAGVIFFVPLLMGGRHAMGQLALTVLAVAAAWAWTARQCLRDDAAWRPTWAAPLVLAGLGLVVLQIVPLPQSVLAWLAPRNAEMLPLWNAVGTSPAALGAWPYLSFTPAETRAGLVLFLDFALLFFVAVERIERVEDVERLLRWCALSAVGMAVFGVVQLLTDNGKFFWFYQHPFSLTSDATHGSFSNRNHFAHFLALGIGPLIWWLQDALRRTRARAGGEHCPRAKALSAKPLQAPAAALTPCPSPKGRGETAELKTYLLGLALGIVLFAGLLSLSRGGIVVMFLAAAVCTAVCYRASSVGGRFVAVLAAAGVLIGVSLAIFGFERISNRLDDLSSGSIERLDRAAGRRNIWAAAATAAADHPLLGTGVGSFPEVYPMHTDAVRNEDLEFTHAENCYLQVAVETGIAGIALTVAGIILVGWWCFQGARSTAPSRVQVCAAAIAGSLTASAVHALVDFVWYVPACMAIVAILAACALRARQLANEELRTNSAELPGYDIRRAVSNSSFLVPRFFWPSTAAILTLLGGWMVASHVGPAMAQPYWDEYLFARHTAQKQSPENLANVERQRQWIACLEDVVRWQPTHVRAHLALAESHRRLFDALQTTAENRMSLSNIRDAAIQSQFPSREALTAWLSRAIGKHWVHLDRALDHTRQALGLSPLQGRAYVYLAELSFLRGADAAAKRACVQQALRVRSFDGAVLYAAGTEALLAGDTARWLEYSKRAFRASWQQQQRFIDDLAAATPSENLPGLIDFVIREFQPDREGLRFLHGACVQRCPKEQLAPLTRYRAQTAEKEAAGLDNCEAASAWSEAQQLYAQLQDHAAALRCAQRAVECDPGNWNAHYQLALCLLQRHLYADAEPHLRWCLQRTPDNQTVEMQLREALKGRLDGQRRAAAESDRLR